MSSQKGNVGRSRSQKYQNSKAFKNDMHDKSRQTKKLNAMVVGGLCGHCKSVIDWKIKYKKYKPLSQPKKCVKCLQKTVKQAYTTICMQCASTACVCTKCGKSEEAVTPATLSPAEEAARDAELQQELKFMPERQRRTVMRYVEKGGGRDKRQEYTDGKQSAEDHSEDSGDDGSSEEDLGNEEDSTSPGRDGDGKLVVQGCRSHEVDGSQQDNMEEREDIAMGIENTAVRYDQLSI